MSFFQHKPLAKCPNNWFITSYRCHALALLLGATPNEILAEFYGRKTGNAMGPGGSIFQSSDAFY